MLQYLSHRIQRKTNQSVASEGGKWFWDMLIMPLTLKLMKYFTELRNSRGWEVLLAKGLIPPDPKDHSTKRRGDWLTVRHCTAIAPYWILLLELSPLRPPYLAELRASDLTPIPVDVCKGATADQRNSCSHLQVSHIKSSLVMIILEPHLWGVLHAKIPHYSQPPSP